MVSLRNLPSFSLYPFRSVSIAMHWVNAPKGPCVIGLGMLDKVGALG